MSRKGETIAYRRNLPHLRAHAKTYFVTFCTHKRSILEPIARDIALSCCANEHRKSCWLESAVVMPDHAHLLLTPDGDEVLETIVGRIKSVSARQINRVLEKRGHVWQHESFDYILRSTDDVRKKAEYILWNPVRAGLVKTIDEYKWVWRWWVEGEDDGEDDGSAAEGGGATWCLRSP
jgi:REP element-mobilizing transposase RayT